MESSVTSDLDRYARFPPGWDGYDGVTFDAQLVSVVQRVAKWTADLFRTLDVVPSEMTPGPASDGSLDLEIAYQGKRLILTFYPETDRVGVYCENGADAEEAQTTLDSSGLARWLSWLVG
ncbi:MAG: hypothetical protein A2289_25250 [Deltaproteobacteria bacterium RIFOXYA12_FULL_58_15]|nr:MAG: hypothetical protein A2289_25250 [Deltaproteobacteria bacterium RIFOXYA12_FULL_58_15]OGR14159.1 MAG: hypothetical protein A2341_26630 [Deltaproteobacteria bacterium RIFOXYB12_FULL_58_9]